MARQRRAVCFDLLDTGDHFTTNLALPQLPYAACSALVRHASTELTVFDARLHIHPLPLRDNNPKPPFMRLACPGLFSCFEKNSTVVAPSRLLAAVAYQQFANSQLQQGRATWERPAVLSLGAWLTRSWQEARYASPDVPALLSPNQEHYLWTRIIEAEQPELFDVDTAARMTGRAARLLAEWQIPSEGEGWPERGDAAQFRRWISLFRQHCESKGLMARADLWRCLPDWIAKRFCALQPATFLLPKSPVPALIGLQKVLGSRAHRLHLEIPFPRSTAAGKQLLQLKKRRPSSRRAGPAELGKQIRLTRSPCSWPACRHVARK